MGTWERIRGRLPWRTIAGVVLALFLAGAGIGGYLVGNSPDIDVEAAGLTAAAEGREQGSEQGMRDGYAQAFRSARERTYPAAYSAAYRAAYSEEFQSAGLDPPQTIPVPDPR